MNNFEWLHRLTTLCRPLRRVRSGSGTEYDGSIAAGWVGSCRNATLKCSISDTEPPEKCFSHPSFRTPRDRALWDMAQVRHLKLLPSDCKLKLHSHNAEKQLHQWAG